MNSSTIEKYKLDIKASHYDISDWSVNLHSSGSSYVYWEQPTEEEDSFAIVAGTKIFVKQEHRGLLGTIILAYNQTSAWGMVIRYRTRGACVLVSGVYGINDLDWGIYSDQIGQELSRLEKIKKDFLTEAAGDIMEARLLDWEIIWTFKKNFSIKDYKKGVLKETTKPFHLRKGKHLRLVAKSPSTLIRHIRIYYT